MAQDFHSPDWYRVSSIRPRLALQVTVQRQRHRGVIWYVLYDPINQRTLRLTPQAWHIVAYMDGQRTVQQLWDEAVARLGADAPPQNDLVQLLSQLHEVDLLLTDALPDLDELSRRRDRQRRERWQRNLINPLAIRIRLWDPDAFLTRTLPLISVLFGRMGLLLWMLVCVPALALAAHHWDALTHSGSDRILAASNLLTMVLVYPLVKALHELGHAWVAKWGGAEVHDMGLMFLVFAPVPYVDASATSAFADQRQRALVAAAGMLTELLLAALALYVWILIEPGTVRSVAFSVMLICGASTLLFNGNPLLRYDGYFVLCDLIEIPNLAQRSNQQWLWWIRRHLFGLRQAQPPVATPGEQRWFAVYAPAALAWRLGVTVGIALFLGQEYLYAGLAVGLWGLAMLLVWPMIKGLRYLASSPELTGRRTRPALVSTAVIGLSALVIGVLPVPMSTYAQGVVWPAAHAQLRAAEAGMVIKVLARAGAAVRAGELTLLLTNDQLETEQRASEARELRQQRAWASALAQSSRGRAPAEGQTNSRVLAEVHRAALEQASEARNHADQGVHRLAIVAPHAGRLEVSQPEDLYGRWLRKGELIGHIESGEAPTVRVIVTQDDIDLVRTSLSRIEVRLAGRLAQVVDAVLVREVPAGDDELPSPALSLEGGGLIAVAMAKDGDPAAGTNVARRRAPQQPRALNRVFQFDIALPPAAIGARVGERAHVRFVHADETLLHQGWRRLRQLLLSQLTL